MERPFVTRAQIIAFCFTLVTELARPTPLRSAMHFVWHRSYARLRTDRSVRMWHETPRDRSTRPFLYGVALHICGPALASPIIVALLLSPDYS